MSQCHPKTTAGVLMLAQSPRHHTPIHTHRMMFSKADLSCWRTDAEALT